MYGMYSQSYAEWARCYDPANIEMATLGKYVDLRGSKVLEVGCGTGRFTLRASCLCDHIEAIDNDPSSIACAQILCNAQNVHYSVCDAYDIAQRFEGQKFDYIIYSWSLNYIDDIIRALTSAFKLLTSNGKIIVLYTSLGEYEMLIKSINGDSKITDSAYDIMKKDFCSLLKVYAEDAVITPFVFPNLDEAVRLNEFFFDVDKRSLTVELLTRLRDELLKHTRENGIVSILDTVNILIGGQ